MIFCSLGTTIDVPTVYGEVQVKIPEQTQPDQKLKIMSKGVKDLKSGTPGGQYLHIKVQTPTKLSKAQKELLEEFRSQGEKKDSIFAKWKARFNK